MNDRKLSFVTEMFNIYLNDIVSVNAKSRTECYANIEW